MLVEISICENRSVVPKPRNQLIRDQRIPSFQNDRSVQRDSLAESALMISEVRRTHIFQCLARRMRAGRERRPGDVDVALDPDSLQSEDGISKDEVRRRFEAQKKEEKGQWAFEEDLSDMIAQESRKRQKRDEEKRGEKRERSYRF